MAKRSVLHSEQKPFGKMSLGRAFGGRGCLWRVHKKCFWKGMCRDNSVYLHGPCVQGNYEGSGGM